MGDEDIDEIIEMLTQEEKIILVLLHKATGGAPSANVSIQTILHGIDPKIISTRKLKRGRVRKILNKLTKKGLVKEKKGRRADGTYSLTNLGAQIARKLLERT